jgi:hypothetical protein
VRNSSLVEWSCADNVTGLKSRAEAADPRFAWVVGERRMCSEAAVETSRGAHASENAGMSSERGVRNPSAVSPRVPGEG